MRLLGIICLASWNHLFGFSELFVWLLGIFLPWRLLVGPTPLSGCLFCGRTRVAWHVHVACACTCRQLVQVPLPSTHRPPQPSRTGRTRTHQTTVPLVSPSPAAAEPSRFMKRVRAGSSQGSLIAKVRGMRRANGQRGVAGLRLSRRRHQGRRRRRQGSRQRGWSPRPFP